MDFKTEIQKTVDFAAKCHANQFRKHTPLPYITHCFEVLAMVAEWSPFDPAIVQNGEVVGDAVPDLIIWKTALCHDIREERPDITLKDMQVALGKETAEVCEELSFFYDPKNPLPENKQKEEYIKTFMTKSLRALIVKCADRICNTRNFLITAPDYAGKYWRKGRPIFEAALSQNEAIPRMFGPDVFACMMYSRDMLQRQIAR